MDNYDFISGLELSTRASNVLTLMQVDSIEKFMALSRADVVRNRGAGFKTWIEVREAQDAMKRSVVRESLPGKAVQCMAELNSMMDRLSASGFFMRLDENNRLRLARYATMDDVMETISGS